MLIEVEPLTITWKTQDRALDLFKHLQTVAVSVWAFTAIPDIPDEQLVS